MTMPEMAWEIAKAIWTLAGMMFLSGALAEAGNAICLFENKRQIENFAGLQVFGGVPVAIFGIVVWASGQQPAYMVGMLIGLVQITIVIMLMRRRKSINFDSPTNE